MVQSRPTNSLPVCLAIHGSSSLPLVSAFISKNRNYTDPVGNHFTAEQLAAQYAFEQVKLDRKGYDSRRFTKILNLLASAGVSFNMEEAQSHVDELISCYTADYGQDEDGEVTFRIKSQTFRLKKYDCYALWARVEQATLLLRQVTPGSFEDRDEEEGYELTDSDYLMDFTVHFSLIDPCGEDFGSLYLYVTADNGKLYVEDLVDFEFKDYLNFHDESGTTVDLMKEKAAAHHSTCVQAVTDYLASQNMTYPPKANESLRDFFPQLMLKLRNAAEAKHQK